MLRSKLSCAKTTQGISLMRLYLVGLTIPLQEGEQVMEPEYKYQTTGNTLQEFLTGYLLL
ncbi:MAG TPA: hypothetical protein VHT70_05225 [Candidatus Saccharimonadales bacterium]|jgi:hypothetical protein|nr:hypothetical protein [Candidatus Saccharimonadales bacterium]